MKWKAALTILAIGIKSLESAAEVIQVVRLGAAKREVKLAVQACAGAFNDNFGHVYVIDSEKRYRDFPARDETLIKDMLPAGTSKLMNVSLDDFLQDCLSTWSALIYPKTKGKYDTMPNVITVAAAERLVPLSLKLAKKYNARIGRDLTEMSTDGIRKLAYMMLNETKGLAFQVGTELASGYLVDFIMKERLFVVYLKNGCIPGTSDHKDLLHLVENGPWPRPVPVFGYNAQWQIFGGYLFEAETDCVNVLGQVASTRASNLAFWSSRHGPTQNLTQPVSEPIQYDRDMTYIALVYGDLDNIDYVQGIGVEHMLDRQEYCQNQTDCFPLTWTMSPKLLDIAPDILQWYYSTSSQSKRDWFIFPPSGTQYSYPGLFPPDVKARYVQQMNDAGRKMNTTGSVHWEWIGSWTRAFQDYFPLYSSEAEGSHISSFFLNNVPWVFPIPSMAIHHEYYKWIEKDVVVFRPLFNWAYGGAEGGVGGRSLTSSKVANELGSLKRGTVAYIYTIQTTDVKYLIEMADKLPAHVKLVSYEQLVSLARQRDQSIFMGVENVQSMV